MSKKNKWDQWDVESAAGDLIKAQAIPNDSRSGFYAAVKVELKKQVEATNKAAADARITDKLHNFSKKVTGG